MPTSVLFDRHLTVSDLIALLEGASVCDEEHSTGLLVTSTKAGFTLHATSDPIPFFFLVKWRPSELRPLAPEHRGPFVPQLSVLTVRKPLAPH